MELNDSKKVAQIYACWEGRYFDRESERPKNWISIYGERGSGKTTVIQRFAQARKNKTRYFSFAGLEGRYALQAFGEAFSLGNCTITSWEEAGKRFLKKYGNQALLVILDDLEFFPQAQECERACIHPISCNRIVTAKVRRGSREMMEPAPYEEASVYIGYRTLADYCTLFPDYSRQEVVRLFSLTGGIPSLLQELDEQSSFEENVRRLLRFDSAFSRFLPEWLGEYFRTPESYYPILLSLARGRERLSEIAQDVEYPYNKCQTYLRALYRVGLVRIEKPLGKKQGTYHLTNSYFAAWCLYLYQNRSGQITSPEDLLREILQNMDNQLTMKAFFESCFRYLNYHTKEYLFDYQNPFASEIRRDIPYKFKDGYRLKLSYCVLQEEQTLVTVMPESLDMKYTKEDIQHIRAAANHLNQYGLMDIVVFSLNRFSDWCVHEASLDHYLHLVTMERLKY